MEKGDEQVFSHEPSWVSTWSLGVGGGGSYDRDYTRPEQDRPPILTRHLGLYNTGSGQHGEVKHGHGRDNMNMWVDGWGWVRVGDSSRGLPGRSVMSPGDEVRRDNEEAGNRKEERWAKSSRFMQRPVKQCDHMLTRWHAHRKRPKPAGAKHGRQTYAELIYSEYWRQKHTML